MINHGGQAAFFSDNYFTLLAGEATTVAFERRVPVLQIVSLIMLLHSTWAVL